MKISDNQTNIATNGVIWKLYFRFSASVQCMLMRKQQIMGKVSVLAHGIEPMLEITF